MTVQPSQQQPRLRETWYGPEKQCTRCGEWWPADAEFFHMRLGQLVAACKACSNEERKRRAKP